MKLFGLTLSKRVIIVVVLLVIIATSVVVFAHGSTNEGAPSSETPVTGESKLVGTLACLPHKNPGDVTTLECAYGIKLVNGTYYALDTIAFPGGALISDLSFDQPIQVNGIVLPLDKVKDESIKKYDIQGVIQVADIEKK